MIINFLEDRKVFRIWEYVLAYLDCEGLFFFLISKIPGAIIMSTNLVKSTGMCAK